MRAPRWLRAPFICGDRIGMHLHYPKMHENNEPIGTTRMSKMVAKSTVDGNSIGNVGPYYVFVK